MEYYKLVQNGEVIGVVFQDEECIKFKYLLEEIKTPLIQIDLREFRDICCKLNCLTREDNLLVNRVALH